MTSLFELPGCPQVPVDGSMNTFPVGRIFCVGRNYAEHAREMGMDPDREAPFFFTKFPGAVEVGDSVLPYPPGTENYHYEAELVIAIGGEGVCVAGEQAAALIFGYAVGLDMTRRDLQLEAREKGRPWDFGKNFAHSAPISSIRPTSKHGHVEAGAIRLTVNGDVKQEADIGDLIWNCREVVSYLSRFERLMPGDLIYTGTPAGVGAVSPGDCIEVTIDGLQPLTVNIAERDKAFT